MVITYDLFKDMFKLVENKYLTAKHRLNVYHSNCKRLHHELLNVKHKRKIYLDTYSKTKDEHVYCELGVYQRNYCKLKKEYNFLLSTKHSMKYEYKESKRLYFEAKKHIKE